MNTADGVLPGEFRRLETNIYGEFGLSEKLMVGGKVLYGTTWLTRGPSTETASGFSTVQGFAQYQILKRGPHTIAAKVFCDAAIKFHVWREANPTIRQNRSRVLWGIRPKFRS